MKKEINRIGKLQLVCGQVKPGANLASLNINMVSFCREFNEQTKNEPAEKIVNVEIIAFRDKTYQFTIKGVPTIQLIKKRAGNKKTISRLELQAITQEKLTYLNTDNLEKAEQIIAGTARSAGIKIV